MNTHICRQTRGISEHQQVHDKPHFGTVWSCIDIYIIYTIYTFPTCRCLQCSWIHIKPPAHRPCHCSAHIYRISWKNQKQKQFAGSSFKSTVRKVQPSTKHKAICHSVRLRPQNHVSSFVNCQTHLCTMKLDAVIISCSFVTAVPPQRAKCLNSTHTHCTIFLSNLSRTRCASHHRCVRRC